VFVVVVEPAGFVVVGGQVVVVLVVVDVLVLVSVAVVVVLVVVVLVVVVAVVVVVVLVVVVVVISVQDSPKCSFRKVVITRLTCRTASLMSAGLNGET
jgi:hypothetical protein